MNTNDSSFKKPFLKYFPYFLALLIFVLRLSIFQVYSHLPPDDNFYFEIPGGQKLNVDSKGWGACAGDFPKRFIEQTRCGYYALARPGYAFILYFLSRPLTWGAKLLPESTWTRIPIKPDLISYAAALAVGIFLNIFIFWLSIAGVKRLLSPYFNNPGYLWLGQVLFASSYGASVFIGSPIPEAFQHLIMIWVPVFFQERFSYGKLMLIALALTIKELFALYAAGFAFLIKKKKFTPIYLLSFLPFISWLLWLKYGHGVVLKSHPAEVYGHGYAIWPLSFFKDRAFFDEKLRSVVLGFFTQLPLSLIPLLWIGFFGFIGKSKKIPSLIWYNLFFITGQVFAMGYINTRILYNFFFMPMLFGTVVFFESLIEKFKNSNHGALISILGYASSIAGLITIATVYNLFP